LPANRVSADIERSFPELAVHEIGFLGAGMDSEAYLVNDELVFRFPMREAVSHALAREIALLPKLAPRLPVAVPRFEYVGRQSSSGLLFVGYPLIPGEPLTLELFESLDPADQESILDTLAAILRAVHTFPLEEAVAAGLPSFSARARMQAIWTDLRERALPLLGKAYARALAATIEGYFADGRNLDVEPPCLLYADFAPEHILYDRATRAITGLIDWGDMTIGDTDYDLLYLYQDYSEDLVRRLIVFDLTPHAPPTDPERLLLKLRVFNACDYIRDIALARDAMPPDAVTIEESIVALSKLARSGSVS
jgi:aminoglycoside 2''-phosphotransferase